MNKDTKNKSEIFSLIILFFNILLIVTSLLLDYKNGWLGHIVYIIAIIVLYKFNKDKWKKFLYSSVLVSSFIGMLLAVPLQPLIGVNMDIYLYSILLAVYMCIILIEFTKKLKNFDKKFKFTPINMLSIMFVIYIFVSMFFVNDIKVALIKLFSYAICICYVIMLVNENRNKMDIEYTLNILKYISVLLVSLGLFKIITGIQIEGKSTYVTLFEGIQNVKAPYNRIPSLFYYNPNDYSVVAMLILIAFAVKFLYDTSNKERIFSIFMIVAAQINIFFTRSRTGWIATICTLVFISIFLAIKMKKSMFLKSLLVSFVVIISFNITLRIPSLGSYTEKINEVVQGDENNNNTNNIEIGSTGSINVRSTLISNTLQSVFKDKNYFGVGVGNGNVYQEMRGNTHRRYDTHNWWFEILLEFGIPGFTFFTLWYILIGLKIFTYYKKQNNKFENSTILLSLSLLVGLSLGVFGPSSVYRFIPFWTVLAFAIIVYNVIIQKTKIEQLD